MSKRCHRLTYNTTGIFKKLYTEFTEVTSKGKRQNFVYLVNILRSNLQERTLSTPKEEQVHILLLDTLA